MQELDEDGDEFRVEGYAFGKVDITCRNFKGGKLVPAILSKEQVARLHAALGEWLQEEKS